MVVGKRFTRTTRNEQTMTGKTRLLTSLLFLTAGCASDPSPLAFPLALARASCGPADGAAVMFELGLTEAQTTISAPYLQIALYRSRDAAAGHSWPLEGTVTTGLATYCATADHCESAVRGTITVGPTTSADTVDGTVDVTFPVRGRIRGTFHAAWQASLALCG